MIKGVVLIEGPDASGKSTLAEKIAKKYNGIIIHQTYRFKNKIPIFHAAILRKALKLSKNQLVILDRLHISEYIYGKVFRNEKRWPWMLKSFNSFCNKLNIPIILCVPLTLQQGIDWFEQTKKERYEMFESMENIIKEYLLYSNKHSNDNNVIIYNRDCNQILYKNELKDNIYKQIEEIINE